MNKVKIKQAVKNKGLRSNIKMQPLSEKTPKAGTRAASDNKSRVNVYYYLSWAAVAALSLASLSMVVLNEGGIDDAVQTANFKKLNRQIAANKLGNGIGVDNLPTASIPTGVNVNENNIPSQVLVKTNTPSFNPFKNNDEDSRIIPEVKVEPSIIATTYFTVFLGQSGNKAAILDLWYETKNKHLSLFSPHKAAYYYDDADEVYNLVVGKFVNLGDSLKFCAELKFNDIACRYDSKFANLLTTLIE